MALMGQKIENFPIYETYTEVQLLQFSTKFFSSPQTTFCAEIALLRSVF